MLLPDYMEAVTKEMSLKSSSIRRDFATHRLSAGENRENLVSKFLKNHLPKRFGISSGLVISNNGMFSNQADLLVVDEQNNSPLYAGEGNELWPVEAVYALIEVKTSLGPTELKDAIAKGRKFKTLQRQYCDAGQKLRLQDSLFVIWAFDSAEASTFKMNLLNALDGVPRLEQPDLIIVLDRLVAKAGNYLELSKIGHAGSPYRSELYARHGSNLESLLPLVEVAKLNENALLAWYVWFDSWLRQAGPRFTTPGAYLPLDKSYGEII